MDRRSVPKVEPLGLSHDEPHHRFLVRELFLSFGEPFEMLVEILHQVRRVDALPDRLGIVIKCQEAS